MDMSMMVNAKQMAKIMDLSERRINQLVTEKVITKDPDGQFNVMKVILDYYKNKNGIGNGINYDEEHALLEKVKRETAEIELAELKGEVHRADDVKKALCGMIITCRNKLLAMPAGVAIKLVGQKNASVIIDILTKEVKIALKELSEYDPKLFVSDQNG